MNNAKIADENLIGDLSDGDELMFSSYRKRDPSRAVVALTRAAKDAITKNNIRLIMTLNLFPLAILILCILYPYWHYTQPNWQIQTMGYNYTLYFSFFYMTNYTSYNSYNSKNNTDPNDNRWVLFNTCENIPKNVPAINLTNYYCTQEHFYFNLLINDCNNIELNYFSITSEYMCQGVVSMVISSCIFIVAFVMHIINIIQLYQLIKKVNQGLTVGCIGIDKVQWAIFGLYSISLIYSIVLLEFELNLEVKIFGVLGIYLIGLFLYLCLLQYFTCIYKRGLDRALVNKLLNAEESLIKQISKQGTHGDGSDDANSDI